MDIYIYIINIYIYYIKCTLGVHCMNSFTFAVYFQRFIVDINRDVFSARNYYH